jgi:hypothetical protein
MFVPSLSWQNDRFGIMKKAFSTPKSSSSSLKEEMAAVSFRWLSPRMPKENMLSFCSFPYVCPGPVLVNDRLISKLCKNTAFLTHNHRCLAAGFRRRVEHVTRGYRSDVHAVPIRNPYRRRNPQPSKMSSPSTYCLSRACLDNYRESTGQGENSMCF